jgi:hypothetical protein
MTIEAEDIKASRVFLEGEPDIESTTVIKGNKITDR